ncbi:MAG: IS110 family transposase [Opitutaceae bacterium]
MKSEVYNVLVGIDRSDAWLDICVDDASGKRIDQLQLKRSTVKWRRWLEALQKRFPGDRIAVCFEQPAANLITFFSNFAFVDIYAINPSSLKAYRQAFVMSGCKDDASDSEWLTRMLREHQGVLRKWASEDPDARKLQAYTKQRRAIVGERNRINNRIINLLKTYQPEMLEMSAAV